MVSSVFIASPHKSEIRHTPEWSLISGLVAIFSIISSVFGPALTNFYPIYPSVSGDVAIGFASPGCLIRDAVASGVRRAIFSPAPGPSAPCGSARIRGHGMHAYLQDQDNVPANDFWPGTPSTL